MFTLRIDRIALCKENGIHMSMSMSMWMESTCAATGVGGKSGYSGGDYGEWGRIPWGFGCCRGYGRRTRPAVSDSSSGSTTVTWMRLNWWLTTSILVYERPWEKYFPRPNTNAVPSTFTAMCFLSIICSLTSELNINVFPSYFDIAFSRQIKLFRKKSLIEQSLQWKQ